MKALFVTDLHGCKWKYERLFEVTKEFGATIVINGGDLLPKDGNLFAQDKFIKNYLDNHFAQFNSAGIYYLCYLGNDDLRIFDELFEEICNKYSFVVCLAQCKFEVGGFEFVGMNWVVDYPFRLKDRCRMDTDDYIFQEQYGTGLLSTPNGFQEIDDWFAYAMTLPTIENELIQLVRPKDMEHSVYVLHMPPYGVGLDKCGHGAEVGSKAIYNFLQKYQPKFSLHGHIHESPEVTGRWYTKLGNTICIQPGQLNEFTYVTIDLSSMRFDRIVEQYVT
jgi:Icc-related predicted phosphoesterase